VDFINNFQTYYKIYQWQLQRWGKSATDYYPLRLFENLAESARTHSQIKLWAAFLDDKMISGLIVFYHNKHLVTWHGATLDEYFEFRPVDILYSTVIEDACKTGLEIFDFANSGGHQNVVNYKERFGAQNLPLYIWRRRDMGGLIYRLGRHIKNSLGVCPED
jgi:CelD/BcsL family acetyltransferase involved in cellulose biosynthesis